MSTNNGTSDDGATDAILEGGPADMAPALRSRRVAITEREIKVLHRGGYEHFECDGEAAGQADCTPVVFRWTTRTMIAE